MLPVTIGCESHHWHFPECSGPVHCYSQIEEKKTQNFIYNVRRGTGIKKYIYHILFSLYGNPGIFVSWCSHALNLLISSTHNRKNSRVDGRYPGVWRGISEVTLTPQVSVSPLWDERVRSTPTLSELLLKQQANLRARVLYKNSKTYRWKSAYFI